MNKKKGIIQKFSRNHHLSKDEKKAVTNSVYTSIASIVAKAGSLLYTIILARLLMPELFGLYSLTLSTLMIIIALSNFGVFNAFVVYTSKELGRKNKQKAKAYFTYLTNIKIILILLASTFILLTAKYIAHNIYQKPIMLGLLAGILYLIISGIIGITKRAYHSTNNFKPILYQEIIFQILRLILVPTAILLSIHYGLQNETILFWTITGIATALLLSTLYLLTGMKHLTFLKEKNKTKLNKKEKKTLHKFLLAVSATAITGSFLTHIDTIMLGKFVLAEYIGYYAAAFSLITAGASLITFSAALLPVFSGMNKQKADHLYQQTTKIVLLIALTATILTILLASPVIYIIFGKAYTTTIPLLRLAALLLLILPITGITSVYLISIGKPGLVTIAKISSAIINIILNYALISWAINYGQIQAVYAATIATITSNTLYLGILLLLKKKKS